MTVDERLREAARDAKRAASTLPDRRLSNPRRPRVLVAFAAFVLVLVVAAPVIIMQGGTETGPAATTPDDRPAATTPDDPNVDSSETPAEVLDYWSLEGTLESIADEPGWLCPAKISVGYTAVVDASVIPAELHYGLPGQSPVDTYLRDDGPTCNQPPALVLLAWTDGQR